MFPRTVSFPGKCLSGLCYVPHVSSSSVFDDFPSFISTEVKAERTKTFSSIQLHRFLWENAHPGKCPDDCFLDFSWSVPVAVDSALGVGYISCHQIAALIVGAGAIGSHPFGDIKIIFLARGFGSDPRTEHVRQIASCTAPIPVTFILSGRIGTAGGFRGGAEVCTGFHN